MGPIANWCLCCQQVDAAEAEVSRWLVAGGTWGCCCQQVGTAEGRVGRQLGGVQLCTRHSSTQVSPWRMGGCDDTPARANSLRQMATFCGNCCGLPRTLQLDV